MVCCISIYTAYMDIDGTDKISDIADYIVQCNTTTPDTNMSKITTVGHYKLHVYCRVAV